MCIRDRVRRDGRILTIKGTEVVPGDIVLLEAGNFVPADCRLINSYNLKIEESSLTGETVPVTKDADVLLDEKTALGDTLNMAFANTIVVNGHGEAIATDIGMNTKVGKIAKMIITKDVYKRQVYARLTDGTYSGDYASASIKDEMCIRDRKKHPIKE